MRRLPCWATCPRTSGTAMVIGVYHARRSDKRRECGQLLQCGRNPYWSAEVADYTIWRDSYLGNYNANADGDDDGDVDQDDYDVWDDHFGNTLTLLNVTV